MLHPWYLVINLASQGQSSYRLPLQQGNVLKVSPPSLCHQHMAFI